MNDVIYVSDAIRDDFTFSTSDESFQKLQSALESGANEDLQKHAANVLIGNIAAKKVSDNIGVEFTLRGLYMKDITFRDSKLPGKYIVLFGQKDDVPVSYYSTSFQVYEAVKMILCVYGDVSKWGGGIPVRIRMNSQKDIKAYSLEIV